MATFRVGVGSFNINDGTVGIGTEGSGHGNLKVEGTARASAVDVIGVSTFTRYSGFSANQVSVNDRNFTNIAHIFDKTNRIIELTGETQTTGDIIVDDRAVLKVGLGSTACVGSLEYVCVKHHFSVPTGGTNQRNSSVYVEGTIRYNTDLGTMEFFNGNEWRQFTYITDVQNSPSGRGRGIFGGGFDGPSPFENTPLMYMIEISTLGNSEFFGDLTLQRRNPGGRISDSTRGLISGGYHEPAARDTIDYCTIASAGNFIDFGNLTAAKFAIASGAVSSSTRGVTAGGNLAPGYINVMDYVQIQTIGNALDFGDLTTDLSNSSGVNSSTKGLFCGGQNPGLTPPTRSNIQSITIASTGNAVDIGDLQVGRYYGAGVSNGVRGVVGGGINLMPGTLGMTSSLEFVTIASGGNAVVFGDLTIARAKTAAVETLIRGVFIGSDTGNPSTNTYTNVMDFVNIASAGNAQDFGDATNNGNHQLAGFSDSHGGLGGY